MKAGRVSVGVMSVSAVTVSLSILQRMTAVGSVDVSMVTLSVVLWGTLVTVSVDVSTAVAVAWCRRWCLFD
jgi:hypothetical protein